MRYAGVVLLVSVGYVAAVLIAVGVAIVLWLVPTVLPDHGAWGSIFASIRNLGGIYMLGLMVTFPSALPGFLVVLTIAYARRWRTWLRFALAGAANAAPALLIYNTWMGASVSDMPIALLLSCFPGGFAGGAAYWAVVSRNSYRK